MNKVNNLISKNNDTNTDDLAFDTPDQSKFVVPDSRILDRCIPDFEIIIHPTFSMQVVKEGVGKTSQKPYRFIAVEAFVNFPNQSGSASRITFNVNEELKHGRYRVLDSAWSTRLDYNKPVVFIDIKNETLVRISEEV